MRVPAEPPQKAPQWPERAVAGREAGQQQHGLARAARREQREGEMEQAAREIARDARLAQHRDARGDRNRVEVRRGRARAGAYTAPRRLRSALLPCL